MFTYLLQQNIRSTHFIIVSLLIYYIDTSYCEVEQGKTKTSDDVSSTSTKQQLTLPNLNDCKNSKYLFILCYRTNGRLI